MIKSDGNKELRAIRMMADDLLVKKKRFLLARGWKESCALPGSVWYFVKTIEGITAAVDMEDALRMEEFICAAEVPEE